MAFAAEYIYRIKDQYSKQMERISRATSRFQVVASSTADKVNRLSYRMQSAGNSMSNFRTAIGGAAIAGGMFKFAKSASDMSDAMADVERVTSLSGPALAKFQEQLQAMGRATGRSAEGLAAIAFEGGKIGITDDQLLSFTETVMKTAAAFDMADSEAGRAIGSIRAKLGLSVDSVNQLMQRVNYLADNTSANGAQMINIIERTSGTFASLNIPPEVTAGWAAFANQVEVTPELAASGLNQMMVKMMQMPGMLEKMLKDPKASIKGFLDKLATMPQIKRNAAVIKMFGLEASRFVMKAVANTKLLDEAMTKAASSKALGSMDREFSNILNRSSTAGKRIKETFIDISRTIGNVFIKVFDKYSKRLIAASEWVLNFVKTHPELIKIVGAVGLLAVALSAVVIPIGVLMSMIGAAMPILPAVAAEIGAILWPVVAVVAGIAALTIAFGAMYAKSAMLRQSVSNLATALQPLWTAINETVIILGKGLAEALGGSGADIKSWGDALSVVIDMIAAMITSLIQASESFGEFLGAISLGNWEDAFGPTIEWLDSIIEKFDLLKDAKEFWSGFFGGDTGKGVASDKAKGRQDKKMEFSGKIDVSASGGAKINKANIGLDTGYNSFYEAAMAQ